MTLKSNNQSLSFEDDLLAFSSKLVSELYAAANDKTIPWLRTDDKTAIFIFDLDETLVKTKDLVIESYRLAGVDKEVVLANWGKRAKDWIDEEMHHKKNLAYTDLLSKRKGLVQGTILYKAMVVNGASFRRSAIITSASKYAVGQLSRHIELPPILASGVSYEVREYILEDVTATGSLVFYLDDNLSTITKLISNKTKIAAYLHLDNIAQEVTILNQKGEVTWKASFSQLA